MPQWARDIHGLPGIAICAPREACEEMCDQNPECTHVTVHRSLPHCFLHGPPVDNGPADGAPEAIEFPKDERKAYNAATKARVSTPYTTSSYVECAEHTGTGNITDGVNGYVVD